MTKRNIYKRELEKGDDDDVLREFECVKEYQKELPISTLHLCKEFNYSKSDIKDRAEIKNIKKKISNDYTYVNIHKSIVNSRKFVNTAVVDVNLVSE